MGSFVQDGELGHQERGRLRRVHHCELLEVREGGQLGQSAQTKEASDPNDVFLEVTRKRISKELDAHLRQI